MGWWWGGGGALAPYTPLGPTLMYIIILTRATNTAKPHHTTEKKLLNVMLTRISVIFPILVAFPFIVQENPSDKFLAVRIFSIGYYEKLYRYKRVVMPECFL